MIFVFSDLLPSAWRSLGSSMLLWMALFHDFYGGVISQTHLLYPFFHQWTFRLLPCPRYCKQCCNEHWGACFFQTVVYSGYMPRSGIAESCDNSIFSWGNSILFSTVAVSIYLCKQCRRFPFSPHSLQHLFVDFLMMVILTGARWCLIVVLMCISLTVNQWCWVSFHVPLSHLFHQPLSTPWEAVCCQGCGPERPRLFWANWR